MSLLLVLLAGHAVWAQAAPETGTEKPATADAAAPVEPSATTEGAPADPGEVAPADPGEVAPADPGEVTPADPGEVAPAGPGEATPEPPGATAAETAESAKVGSGTPEEPAAAAGGPASPRVVAETRTALAVRTQVQVFVHDEARGRQAIAAAFAEIERVEALLAEWKPESDVARLNQAAGRSPVEISAEASQVLARGKEVSAVANGAFSLTWAALASVWSFGPGGRVPAAERIRERLALVDDRKLILDKEKRSAFLEQEGMAVGVAGLAKGYAIHRALLVLEQAGIEHALVFVGGDIGVRGRKGDQPWTVGIQDPRAKGFFAVLPLAGRAIATTGDYERYFEVDGKRYHHILDPRTGMPATQCRSATVLAGDAVTADALATAVFVLGPEKGLELVEGMEGVEGLVVAANNEVSMSKGLNSRARIVRPPTD